MVRMLVTNDGSLSTDVRGIALCSYALHARDHALTADSLSPSCRNEITSSSSMSCDGQNVGDERWFFEYGCARDCPVQLRIACAGPCVDRGLFESILPQRDNQFVKHVLRWSLAWELTQGAGIP